MSKRQLHGPDMKPSRTTQRRVDKLVHWLDQIQASTEPQPELLQRFQDEYQELSREETPFFFDAILRRMETKWEDIEEQLRQVIRAEHEDPIHWSRVLTELRRRMESPRLRTFRRFVNVSGGFKFLLDFRFDVLTAQRQTSLDLDPLDEELAHLFNTWFQHGFLFLQEITRDSSFRQIRFLKGHDMVHPMASLEEMGTRLGEDRRCFALYHRAMPEEPIVFIEAALTRGLAHSIHEIIGKKEPNGTQGKPDTAIFYSINNTQNGLAGLGLGKALIFQVVDVIKRDQPSIRTFATLSPITGLWTRYLGPILRGEDQPFSLKRARVDAYFTATARRALMAHHAQVTGRSLSDLPSTLLEVLSNSSWIEDTVYAKWLRRPLTDITYYYIYKEKNRKGKPLNPVANFHLSNGARVGLKNIHFGANRSERGLTDSCGMMVNYVYSKTWLHQIGRTMQSWLPWSA